MRIGFVSTMAGSPWGGSEELWAAAATEAVRRGFDVHAFVFQWPDTPSAILKLKHQGVNIVSRKRGRGNLAVRAAAKLLQRPNTIWRQLRRCESRIVIISQGGTFDIAHSEPFAEYLLKATRPFILVSQHNGELPISDVIRERAAAVFARAARIVFVSETNRLTAERQLASRIPNATVLQNPVNVPGLQSVEWPVGPVQFACVARLDVGFKGQDVLLQVLAVPSWKAREWTLNLYGEGPDREYLISLANHYNLTSRVRFCGHSSDLIALWRKNHLLILPSRSEGTPLALIESLVCGRPAVVTDVGDSARWIEDGVTGFIAEAPTFGSLSRAMNLAWRRQEEWKVMGENAHTRTLSVIDKAPGSTLLDMAIKWCLET